MQRRRNLKDLFGETLKDIYFAEKQILRALPKMAYQAEWPELKQAFETHRGRAPKPGFRTAWPARRAES